MDIQVLRDILVKLFPDAQSDLAEPFHEDGLWTLNIWLNAYALSIEWSEDRKFGITSAGRSVYGEGVHITVPSLVEAADLCITLLHYRFETLPNLIDMRTEQGVTQAHIAALIGKGQSFVSKLEKKPTSELSLKQFGDYVTALGGEPIIGAKFRDKVVDLDPLQEHAAKRPVKSSEKSTSKKDSKNPRGRELQPA